MQHPFKLTVADILSRPNFENAEVIAGKEGLSRTIRWVHIIEIPNIGSFVNGYELVLTTGIGWKENNQLSLDILQQLIDKNASALCIELGTYISSIPKKMIELANKHLIPIIIFNEPVRFIDISQDLNGLLIETHNQKIVKLEAISNQFNRLLLSTDGFYKILRLLYQSLDVQVVYRPVGNDLRFFPPLHSNDDQDRILEEIKSAEQQSVMGTPSKSALKPVEALGNKFADLIILTNQNELTELDYLVLDRAATALSQDHFRRLYVEEKRNHEENQWILKWLHGEHDQEEITRFISDSDSTIHPNKCVVCICHLKPTNKHGDLTYYSMIFNKVFNQQGYYSFVTIDRNRLIFSLINIRSETDWKERLSCAINQICKNDLLKKGASNDVFFGIGKIQELGSLHDSYEQAKDTIYVQYKTGIQSMFYDDLYIYRLLLNVKKSNLQTFVDDYLGPVFTYDQQYNGEMLETLKVLLEFNGARKETAEKLFIVRQTLYHRIEKLKELLGDDFMKGEKRLAIEFSIYAFKFFNMKHAKS